MHRSRIILALAVLFAPVLAKAQTPDPQALAEIRSELSALYAQMVSLRALIEAPDQSQQAGSQAATGEAPVLRLARLEEEMRALTGKVEQLEFRIDQIATDGTRRIGDLEFRLVELEGGDVTTLGETTLLGGAIDTAAAPAPRAAGPGVQLAVSEQSDFDTAKASLESGDLTAAVAGFRKFLADYPGGPLAAEAMFHIGEAETRQGAHKSAAKAYLDSFTAAPDGPYAASSLMKVGLALGMLGKPAEACQTLNEVLIRYPGTSIQDELLTNRQALGCG